MVSTLMNRDEVGALLKESIGLEPQVVFAERMGISPQLLNDIISGRRNPSKSVLDHLGLEKKAGPVFGPKARRVSK